MIYIIVVAYKFYIVRNTFSRLNSRKLFNDVIFKEKSAVDEMRSACHGIMSVFHCNTNVMTRRHHIFAGVKRMLLHIMQTIDNNRYNLR